MEVDGSMQYGPIKVFCGNANRKLAEDIASLLGGKVGACSVGKFSDGETSVSTYETVRGCDVFIIQSTSIPVNDNLMELLVMIDAFKRASAARITAVIPYFGYARQDRKAKARDPITAKLVANLLTTAGANRVLTMDLHAPQIQGFFDIPLDHLLGAPVLAAHYAARGMGDGAYTVISSDLGSVTRARNFAAKLGAPLAIIDKRRPRPNQSEVLNIIGEVRGRKCLLVDDMIDTAGTLVGAAEALDKNGATDIMACCTHAVLSGPAVERIRKSPIRELVVTDTIELPPEKAMDKIQVLSVATLFAEAIERIYYHEAVSPLFDQAPLSVKPLAFQERMEHL